MTLILLAMPLLTPTTGIISLQRTLKDSHRVGGQSELWDLRGYGLFRAWVMTGFTVVTECSIQLSTSGLSGLFWLVQARTSKKGLLQGLQCRRAQRWNDDTTLHTESRWKVSRIRDQNS